MADPKTPQEFKAPTLLIFISGLVLFLFWYAIQDHIGTKFLIPYLVGFFISIGGILHISIKIYLTEKKPFTDCKEITPKDLSRMMFFLSIVGLSMSFRTPNPLETAIITRVEIQFLILLTNILISVGAIHLMVANKTTRETIIVLGLSVIYFWTGFYVYNMGLNNLLFSLLNSTALITLIIGIHMLSQQKDKNDIFQGEVAKLQKTRKTAKELQDKLTESEFAKTISHISDVPLTEAPPPKIAWDVDYDVRKTKENRYFAQQLKQQLETLEKLKNQEPNENDKNLLTMIEQTKKHLDSLKQQITQLEKVKTSHSSALQRTAGHYSSYNDSVGQFQQNAPLTLEKINTLLTQMQSTLQQHKEKLQKQHKDEFDQVVNKLKLDIKRLGGE
jgi:hypothetical protein